MYHYFLKDNRIIRFAILGAFLFLPSFVFAQGADAEAIASAKRFLVDINNAILFPLIALMMAVALLVFLFGAFEYVRGANNDQAREQGKRHLLFGTIGLLVMISAVAILTIAANTFGVDDELDNASSGIGGGTNYPF